MQRMFRFPHKWVFWEMHTRKGRWQELNTCLEFALLDIPSQPRSHHQSPSRLNGNPSSRLTRYGIIFGIRICIDKHTGTFVFHPLILHLGKPSILPTSIPFSTVPLYYTYEYCAPSPQSVEYYHLEIFRSRSFSSTVCCCQSQQSNMDIVLEVFDTFLFDRLYATLLPASSMQHVKAAVQNVATSTFSSMREMPTPYQPATQLFHFKPSELAYMSVWARDNLWRQALSLYLITWYVDTRETAR